MGNWDLIKRFRGKFRKIKSFDSHIPSAEPDEIIKIVKNQQKLPELAIKSQHSQACSLKTHESLARYLVKQDLVHLDAKTGTFLIDNLNKKRHAVVLNEMSCSCSSNKMCVHILAARFAARDNVPKLKKPTFTLSKLCKMKKGRKKKGRKGPLSKSEITINPAPDSITKSISKYEKELLMTEDDLLDNIEKMETSENDN